MLRRGTSPFDAIAHPVRRELLAALRDAPRPLSVSALGAFCKVSRSTASRHLDVLHSHGFVAVTRWQTSALYVLVPKTFVTIDDWLWPFFDTTGESESAGEPG